MHTTLALTLAATLAIAALPLHAQHSGHGAGAAKAGSSAAPLSEGEVRRLDAAAGKVTFKHGPLANLDMPPMTMTFDVKDRKSLEGLKVGDKVRFRAEMEGKDYVVTRIEK